MASAERKLDIFPHIFPLEYFERMKRIAEGNPGLAAALKRWMHIPVLWDLERRIKMMKRWPGYQQVLTLSMPAIEFLGNVNGRPLDDPEFFPIFERISRKYDLPIWVHPSRTAKWADYPTEQKSKYEMWWLFGWPYETSVFMGRLVFSGMFDKLPQLKIITHHLGAMVPFLANRVAYGMDQFGTRTADEDYEGLRKRMKKRPVDY